MKSTEQGVAPYGAQGAPPVNADVGVKEKLYTPGAMVIVRI